MSFIYEFKDVLYPIFGIIVSVSGLLWLSQFIPFHDEKEQ